MTRVLIDCCGPDRDMANLAHDLGHGAHSTFSSMRGPFAFDRLDTRIDELEKLA